MNLKERYIGRKYEELTKEEIRMFEGLGIFNGFGGGGQNPIIKFLIGRILRKFNIAIANKHDYGFWIGGDLKRFYECNLKFYQAMKKDSMSVPGIAKLYYLLISFLSYHMINKFGKKYFHFYDN